MPRGTTLTVGRWRPRNEPLLSKDEKARVRRRLLIGSGLLQLLCAALVITLFAGGQRGDGIMVLAPDTYLLSVRTPSPDPLPPYLG